MFRNDLLIECPSCKEKVSIRAIRCPQCETDLRRECKVCKSLFLVSCKECPECGTPCLLEKQQQNILLTDKQPNIFLSALFLLGKLT